MRLSNLAVGIVMMVMLATVPAALAQRGEGKAGKARGEAGEPDGKDDGEDGEARPGAGGWVPAAWGALRICCYRRWIPMATE